MARKGLTRGGRPEKLKRSDPLFYQKLGERGGAATAKNRGKEFYRRLAELSHASKRRNKERALETETGSAE